ncbi:MAG TPA: transaldolase family protein [Candidatus Xenobia bacterium]
MALYVDTAALPEAEWALRLPFVSGFTCNPVLVAEALGKSEVPQNLYDAHLEQLAALAVPDDRLFVQVTSVDEAGIRAEAQRLIAALLKGGERKLEITIKIPFTEEGLAAAHALNSSKVSVAITGVFSPEQAYMAGATGVDYVIPYVSRLMPVELGPVPVVREMLEILKVQGLSCRLLAASVKSASDLCQLLLMDGVDVTVPPSLLRATFGQPALKEANTRFKDALKIH